MKREEIQLKAIEATDGHKRCGLGLATGVGKTLVGLMHMHKNTTGLMKVLVVAPKTSIFKSWKDEAIKFNLEDLLDRIEFTTYLSLSKKDPSLYDALYLDECHSLLYSHGVFLENFKGKILGLTGTPPKRENSEKGEMVSDYCPIIYTYVTDDAVESNILNDYRVIVHELHLSNKKDIEVKAKGKVFYTSEVANYDYWSTRVENARPGKDKQISSVMRMKAMMEYPSKERYAKELLKSINSKCIVFANTQDQADRMCTHSYHSNNPNSETNLQDFKAGNITKLSCVMQLNEGVNIPGLKQGIIMHAYGNERKASQRIGRLLRLNPDDKAIVHILCYIGTVDEKWVKEALEDFDQSKIVWRKYNL